MQKIDDNLVNLAYEIISQGQSKQIDFGRDTNYRRESYQNPTSLTAISNRGRRRLNRRLPLTTIHQHKEAHRG